MGAKAVELLSYGEGSKAVGISGGEITAYDLDKALKMERGFGKDIYEMAEILS